MRVSNEPPPEDLITTTAAARLAKVNISSLWRWIGRGHLRAWKKVGRVMVSKADVLGLTQPYPVKPRERQPRKPDSRQQAANDRWTRETLARFGLKPGPTPNDQQ